MEKLKLREIIACFTWLANQVSQTVSITEVGDFETLTYPPTKNYNSERNNRTGTRPQFWLYCVIGRLFISKWKLSDGKQPNIITQMR
jgi:hypothetical protein